MKKKEMPRVLVVDVNAWREDAPSNTLLDIFRCWDPEKLALVYTSSAFPSTKVCSRFFQIGESQVLKSVFKPWMRVGREVTCNSCYDNDTFIETDLRRRAHRSHSKMIRLAREFVWKIGRWKTEALRTFIKDFNPDIVFVPIFPYAYMGRIQQYILDSLGVPYVCYLADDNYSYDSCSRPLDYLLRFWTRGFVGPLARSCKEMFVIVDKEKEDTDARFGTHSVILTKSVDFTNKTYVQRAHHKPLRIVYTGSLVIGRDCTIALLADIINNINREFGSESIELNIYSHTSPSEDIMRRINHGSSHYCGSIPHQQIEQVLQDSDIVVFAEALSGKQANIAKLSFSTKITDYLSEGKCILAIGSENIAPIDYLKRYNAGIIATSETEIRLRIKEILDHEELIDQYGANAFQCALANHEKEKMTTRFIRTMCRAMEE